MTLPFLDQYRDARSVRRVMDEIHRVTTRPWRIMEVCGGQTHAIVRFGIEGLLPEGLTLVHGPGCPVCVTPAESIEKAISIASRLDVIFCTYGDMLRVPTPSGDLQSARSQGADVRIVYSPIDALSIARRNHEKKVVFFAVGFETTAPANAMAIHLAKVHRVANFFALVSQVLIPPAMAAILAPYDCNVHGFLAAGHVCTVSGYADYAGMARQYRVPIVVTGFEPLDLVQGILMCLRQLESGRHVVENQYTRSACYEGNPQARALIDRVFMVADRSWRGMGTIPSSGLVLRPEYAAHDAEREFESDVVSDLQSSACLSGSVLRGRLDPRHCPEFGSRCTPEHPLGATMVSSEGACAAYFHYRPGDLEPSDSLAGSGEGDV